MPNDEKRRTERERARERESERERESHTKRTPPKGLALLVTV